jgi:hypothetical protein
MKDDDAFYGQDIRQTHRKQLKIDYFSKECSEILTKFLYVSGDQIAANLETLEENGITHVINACGDLCENHFEDKIKYLRFFLKDSKKESIECVFYECIEFIEEARANGGRVLVHC